MDEPLLVSLWKYDLHDDRHRVEKRSNANLVSSVTREGMQVPIIDLDYPHAYIPSASPGHGHLYLNVPISRWRWWVLMIGLRVGGVIEKGFFVWSLRRGGNFTRLPGAVKSDHGESRSGFGWILPKRKNEQEK